MQRIAVLGKDGKWRELTPKEIAALQRSGPIGVPMRRLK